MTRGPRSAQQVTPPFPPGARPTAVATLVRLCGFGSSPVVRRGRVDAFHIRKYCPLAAVRAPGGRATRANTARKWPRRAMRRQHQSKQRPEQRLSKGEQ